MGAGQQRSDNPAGAALLLVDLINDFEFDGGDALLAQTLPIVPNIVALKRQARETGVPVIYVNDNFGRWRSDFRRQVEHCLHDGVRGRPVVEKLLPDDDDYFVLKPRSSGFFSSALDSLLEYLGVRTLVICGVAGNICIWFTASDGYMRDFKIIVPRDCIASENPADNEMIVGQMQKVLKADIRPSPELDLAELRRQALE